MVISILSFKLYCELRIVYVHFDTRKLFSHFSAEGGEVSLSSLNIQF